MPRIARVYSQTTFFHVITQGIERSYIFKYDDDIKYYIKVMNELIEEYKLKIIAYCIMNNHAHILINVESTENLSKYMHRLNTKYAIFYNKKHNRVGYVFRDRYKSEGIYNEVQLYNCIEYIYNNPVKAGICKFPWEYPYSNYKKTKTVPKKSYKFLEVESNKELIENKEQLREKIINLKESKRLSLREISRELKINREKIRKIYNNEK